MVESNKVYSVQHTRRSKWYFLGVYMLALVRLYEDRGWKQLFCSFIVLLTPPAAPHRSSFSALAAPQAGLKARSKVTTTIPVQSYLCCPHKSFPSCLPVRSPNQGAPNIYGNLQTIIRNSANHRSRVSYIWMLLIGLLIILFRSFLIIFNSKCL